MFYFLKYYGRSLICLKSFDLKKADGNLIYTYKKSKIALFFKRPRVK